MTATEPLPTAASPNPNPVPGEQTTKLVADIAEDAGTLITQHANLFQAEMRDGLRAAKWWALSAAVGTVMLVIGLLLTAIAAVYILIRVTGLPEWGCWTIVGLSLLALGGVLAFVGGRYLFGVSLFPNRTIKSLSETWSWLVKRSK